MSNDKPPLLDRDFQHQLLVHLVTIYPKRIDPRIDFWKKGAPHLDFNAAYLHEHGLIEVDWARGHNGDIPVSVKATAKGIDYLSQDGGLSAILNVVTVRLHEDTIKHLLIDRVEKSAAPPTVKKKLTDQIKALPAEALKQVSLKAIEAGIDGLPDVVAWLHKSLSP